MPEPRELLDTVLDMHRAADVFAEDFGAITVAFPCPTRKVIEGGRDGN